MQLVTGASGFIGQHLVRYLSGKGHTVKALYYRHEPDSNLKNLPGVSWVKADLLDIYDVETVMQQVEDIYHCAAVVSFDSADREWILHFNKESTANVVNEALEQGVRKMVYVSSIAALGRNTLQKEITEEEQWEESKYNSVYAQSKHEAELEVWRGIGEGLSAVIINPGIILGEGDWDKGSAALIKLAYKEFPFYTQGVNAWVDVADVVEIMYRLMQSDVEAERFIISAGNFSYKEIFTLMADSLSRKPPHIKATPFMTGLIWRWNWLKKQFRGKKTTITKETASTAQRHSTYNNSKLYKHLPEFTYTPLKDTIKRMGTAFIRDKE
jgi:dihydroflavonol-4-reductase